MSDGECEEAFKKLKEICTSITILGLAVILYQNQDEVDYVMDYAGRSLGRTKCKYLAHKQEFLALKWEITGQFHKYLYSNTSVIYTDNNLLTYILTSAKLDATGHHWVASLANYNFA